MNGRRTILLSLLSLCLATASQAQLAWEKTELELTPPLGEANAVGVFKYQNKGDKPIQIKAVRTSCGCTTAALQKNDVAPGEKGEITATFKIGDRTGLQVKTVTVETDDAKQPTTVLTLKATIAQYLDLQPTFVFWQSGEPAKAKTIVAKAGKGVSIKNIEVSSSSPEFTTKVEPGSAGEFKINITPRDTAKPLITTLTIKPDSSAGGAKVYYASAKVTGPTAAAQAPETHQ